MRQLSGGFFKRSHSTTSTKTLHIVDTDLEDVFPGPRGASLIFPDEGEKKQASALELPSRHQFIDHDGGRDRLGDKTGFHQRQFAKPLKIVARRALESGCRTTNAAQRCAFRTPQCRYMWRRKTQTWPDALHTCSNRESHVLHQPRGGRGCFPSCWKVSEPLVLKTPCLFISLDAVQESQPGGFGKACYQSFVQLDFRTEKKSFLEMFCLSSCL